MSAMGNIIFSMYRNMHYVFDVSNRGSDSAHRLARPAAPRGICNVPRANQPAADIRRSDGLIRYIV